MTAEPDPKPGRQELRDSTVGHDSRPLLLCQVNSVLPLPFQDYARRSFPDFVVYAQRFVYHPTKASNALLPCVDPISSLSLHGPGFQQYLHLRSQPHDRDTISLVL